MKNLFRTIAVAVLLLGAAAASAQSYGRYEVRKDRVYFNGIEVRTADARWFSDLGYGYAKDRSHVYLNGQILPYVDPSSFRIDRRYGPDSSVFPGTDDGYLQGWYNEGYIVAGNAVLYNGFVVTGARASSFRDLGWGYAKDAFTVYYCGQPVSGVSVSSFKVLKDGYAKSSYEVVYLGNRIHGAVASSFRLISDGYAKDAFSVFYCGEKMHQANVNTFKVLRGGYASDAFHAYYMGKTVK